MDVWLIIGWSGAGLLVLIIACLVALIWHLKTSTAELRRLIAEAAAEDGGE